MAEKTGKQLNQYVKNYVIFDLETTGLNPTTDRIIEISGIKVRNAKIADTFSTLVNPLVPIPYAATKVNGITDQMVQDAPTLHSALEQFFHFIGTDILVGHNIHTFDMNFLSAAAQQEFGMAVPNDYVDTLRLSRNCLPELSHHRLTDIAKHFGIETDGAHRALNDCTMNQKVYENLGKLLHIQKNSSAAEKKENICPKCGCTLVKRNGKFGEFWGCSGFPMCRFTKNA
ncbi:MAG: exonuclease domain-containing protein [Roseburia sp.]|nr:exonuclease domain-containing protein [Roseburia sp.]